MHPSIRRPRPIRGLADLAVVVLMLNRRNVMPERIPVIGWNDPRRCSSSSAVRDDWIDDWRE